MSRIMFLMALFVSQIAFARLEEHLFIKAEAIRLGISKSTPQFTVGEKFTFRESGVRSDLIETTILDVDGDTLKFETLFTNLVKKTNKVEAWINLKDGQLIKYVYNGVDQTKSLKNKAQILKFDQISEIKSQTIFGEKDCQVLTVNQNLGRDLYALCVDVPGAGVIESLNTMMGSQLTTRMIEYNK